MSDFEVSQASARSASEAPRKPRSANSRAACSTMAARRSSKSAAWVRAKSAPVENRPSVRLIHARLQFKRTHLVAAIERVALANSPDPEIDWRRVAYLLHVSRALDDIEETRLVPERKIFYQFSARGHDLAQILLGLQLTQKDDAICGYYRSRPILLTLGVPVADTLGSSMARAGGYSDGRDIGAVFNFPNPQGPSALPMCGGVGAQFTPTAGWAQALVYRRDVLREKACDDAIAVALGGDASVATNGF